MVSLKGIRKQSQRWSEFRFAIIGHLFSNPPMKGEIKREIRNLSEKQWSHPVSGEKVRFAFKTIEEWYYKAKNSAVPVDVLRRKSRLDMGKSRVITGDEKEAIVKQYQEHKSWTYKLHADNYNALVEKNPSIGEKHSYPTVMRFMKSCGFFKERQIRNGDRPGLEEARIRREKLEIRSFESEYVGGLYHLDFHVGSKQVLLEDGTWKSPILLCVLDDRSRLICHIQWFLNEDTEALVHGVIQSFQKRGLPRALMSDNGSAMVSSEFTEGLQRLSILHETTLSYSPYQNGKQESLWGQVEGRLVAMLEKYKDLDLKFLNNATQAWAEMEYNRKVHSETKEKPLDRFLSGKRVTRPCPSYEELKKFFTTEENRIQRRSDGTVSIKGKRFEVPNRFRHIQKICVRYARWDLGNVYMADGRSGGIISRLYPVNKIQNANGQRRSLEPIVNTEEEQEESQKLPPLLEKLISDYSATGLPPAYIPEERKTEEDNKI